LNIGTKVEIDGNNWKIQHTYDEYEIMKDCYERRMSGNEGDTGNGTGKLIARIPRHRLHSDIELQIYCQYKGKDNKEANKWLDRWLEKHPEFRTTTGGRKGI